MNPVMLPRGCANLHKYDRSPEAVPAMSGLSLAASPARSTIRAKPAVVNGAPRSEVNTKVTWDLAPAAAPKEQQDQCWSYS
jgi:hypothetical protein